MSHDDTTQSRPDPSENRLPRRASRWWLAPVIAASMGLGAALGATAVAWSAAGNDDVSDAGSTLRQMDLFGAVLARVRTDYVVQTRESDLIEAAIGGMLQSLDPHSSFMSAEGFRSMQTSTRGEYGGLGLEVTSEDGAVKVISPMDGSPAARAGIRAGDSLIAIDGTSILGLPLDQAVEQMRGPAGSTIDVTVARDGQEPMVVRITREVIVLRPVTHRMEGDIGYIRISTFVNENTGEALNDAIDQIQREQGGRLRGVVIDLRNNGGGLLDQAIAVTDTFMDRGEVVSTRGRRADDIQRYYGNPGERLANVPIVILINEGTASASEIVAGALQDRGRATIMGMSSFGKGSVQTVIPLNNGRDGALRLTTARYYTPAGRSIQGSGIEPDVEVSSVRVTPEDLERRRAAFQGEENLPHALDNDSGVTRRPPHMPADMPPEGWVETEDYQLKRALDFLREGRTTSARAAAAPAAAPAAGGGTTP